MIGSLRGMLLDRSAGGELLVEVGGVGYRVLVPTCSSELTGELGGPVFLHVHTHVREDAIILYGFSTRDARGCFEALVATHGIGPAVALSILSVHSPSALRRAVATDDADTLTTVPGIGKKTAARLLLELKNRLDLPEAGLEVVGEVAVAPGSASASARSDVRAALASLGYGADEVRAAVRDLPEDGTVEEQLRLALRRLVATR